MSDSIIRLGVVIRTARLNTGLTQNELAKTLQISRRHLCDIEHGIHKPSYDLLCSIIAELDIQIENIFHPEITYIAKNLDEAIILMHQLEDYEVDAICVGMQVLIRGKRNNSHLAEGTISKRE